MAFVLYCLDKPDAAQVRLENRAAHLEYAKSWGDAVTIGGPLLRHTPSDDTSETTDTTDTAGAPEMIGSLIVLNVENQAEVDRFIAGDPYGLAGLFESVTVHPYKIALSNAP